MHFLSILVQIAQAIVALMLIFIVAIQQSKNEGLGAAVSGRPVSSFKGKAGYEEKLTEYTRLLGGAFLVLGIAAAALYGR